MIDYFQKNPSNRATCQRCKQFITDKMRGVEEYHRSFGHKGYRYYCLKCCEIIIQETKKELQNMEETLKFQAKKLAVEK